MLISVNCSSPGKGGMGGIGDIGSAREVMVVRSCDFSLDAAVGALTRGEGGCVVARPVLEVGDDAGGLVVLVAGV